MILPSPHLSDDDARATFADTLDENFCVSAGAGVGKTTAIVKRIANLALRRHAQVNPLPRLVVVTYGKLAAEELRIRTRDALLQHLDQSAVGRQSLLTDLRGAFFGTIHSFCLKLIRDEGRFLGLPEAIALLEERESDELWQSFCESEVLLKLEFPPLLLERVGRHLTFDQLLDLARQLGPDEIDRLAGEGDLITDPPMPDFSLAFGDDGGRSKEKTREHQRALRLWQQEFEEGAAFLQLPEFKNGSSSFLLAVDQALEPYSRWLNAAAGCLAVRIAKTYRDYRLDKGLMTFRDQIYWCRRLVDDPLVLNRLRMRGYIVILDEAQDTDAEMFSILTEITRPIGAIADSWPKDPDAPGPEPGRFCFVGDDQQAIYSERADLAVYRRYVDAFTSGNAGRHLELSVTMRCPQRVVGLVNAVFAHGRITQPFVQFRELAPRPDAPTGATWRLEIDAMHSSDGRSPGIDARLTHECERIASYIKMQGCAGLGVADWSDVAIICPRVRWLEIASQVFEEHGLPCCLLSQKRTMRELARFSWPAALFHVLINPWDRFELVGVLREIFAVSDVELARLHSRSTVGDDTGALNFWPETPAEPTAGIPSKRLWQALHLLHDLRRKLPLDHSQTAFTTPSSAGSQASYVTLSRYVDLVLSETALDSRLEAIGEPSQTLEQLRSAALRAECDGLNLRAWVRSLIDSLDRPPPSQDSGQTGIQLLTCLKAKGLEWPVVIPLGLGCEIRERNEQYPQIERHEGQTEIHFSKTTVDPQHKSARSVRCAEEFQRMLYVTLTRAKRLLVLPDSRSLYNGRAPNFFSLVRWDELDSQTLLTATTASSEASRSVQSSEVSTEKAKLSSVKRQHYKRASAASRQIPKRILPSGLSHSEGTDMPPNHEDSRILFSEEAALLAADCEDPVAEIGGIDYGNWWHLVMQRYPWKAANSAEREGYLQGQRQQVAASVGWTARAEAELSKFAVSAAHSQWLQEGDIFLPEMPFSYPRNAHEWMEGIMDLVILSRGRKDLWIVDWKTDRRWPPDTDNARFLQRLADKYGPQLRAYAEVFAQGLGRPVGRLTLYSTVLGITVDVSPTQAAS